MLRPEGKLYPPIKCRLRFGGSEFAQMPLRRPNRAMSWYRMPVLRTHGPSSAGMRKGYSVGCQVKTPSWPESVKSERQGRG